MRQTRISLKNLAIVFLFLITIVGLILRIYNLNWGAPFYFHPDERNIASSVSQLRFPQQMNPHFFAYGSFPIYLIYFSGVLFNTFSFYISYLLKLSDYYQSFKSIYIVDFEQAILISRFFSSIFSTLLIGLMFFVGKKLGGEKVAILTALLTTFSVGFLQFAHFGTFEIWLTFLGALLFYCCLQTFYNVKRKKYLVLVGVLLGLLNAVKVSSLALLPFPFIAIIAGYSNKSPSIKSLINLKTFTKIFLSFILVLLVGIFIYVLTSPFVLLDQKSFWSSMKYESDVALGTLSVFYTRQFMGTVPVVFQFLQIYPFLLNPLIAISFIPALLIFIFTAYSQKRLDYLFVLLFLLVLFASQAFFFAKWTRYAVPAIPFVYLIISVAVVWLFDSLKGKKTRLAYILLITSGMVFCALFAISYFFTVFAKEDTRVAAAKWAEKNVPADAKILSETYDMGIVPFNINFRNIDLFNFYDLESSNIKTDEGLVSLVSEYEYIVIPSQRVVKSRLLKPKYFPVGNRFYQMLFDGRLGFVKIYQTPCNILCRIVYIGSPVFGLEETASVFDRPTVFIFRSTQNTRSL